MNNKIASRLTNNKYITYDNLKWLRDILYVKYIHYIVTLNKVYHEAILNYKYVNYYCLTNGLLFYCSFK